MIATIPQQKEILKLDRWAVFSPDGDILHTTADKSFLHDILFKNMGVMIIDEPDYKPDKLCSDYEASCYQHKDINNVLICWLGKPQELEVADGFCPVLGFMRYLYSCDNKYLEK